MLDGVAADRRGVIATMHLAATISLFALIGAACGALHFVLLRYNIGLLADGGSARRAIAAGLGRLALTVAIFVWAAVFHGLGVLWMLGGFMLARAAAVRIVQAEA
jgi:N-ATPase, AtpR subunit